MPSASTEPRSCNNKSRTTENDSFVGTASVNQAGRYLLLLRSGNASKPALHFTLEGGAIALTAIVLYCMRPVLRQSCRSGPVAAIRTLEIHKSNQPKCKHQCYQSPVFLSSAPTVNMTYFCPVGQSLRATVPYRWTLQPNTPVLSLLK
jgi:hypothetical protein